MKPDQVYFRLAAHGYTRKLAGITSISYMTDQAPHWQPRRRKPRTPRFPKKKALAIMSHEFEKADIEPEVVQALRRAAYDLVRSIPPTWDQAAWLDGVQAAAVAAAPYIQDHIYADFKLWAAELREEIAGRTLHGIPTPSVWSTASADAMQTAANAPIPYRGLLRVRDYRGVQVMLEMLRGGHRVVRLSPHQARYAIYVSQAFFETDKATRAVSGLGLAEPLPASVAVREEDGYVHFVLADGHHRALVSHQRGLAQLLRPNPELQVKKHMSFRLYIRQNWGKLP